MSVDPWFQHILLCFHAFACTVCDLCMSQHIKWAIMHHSQHKSVPIAQREAFLFNSRQQHVVGRRLSCNFPGFV